MDSKSLTAAYEMVEPAHDALLTGEAAFRSLYEQTSARLFAYLLRASGQRALSEDLLQETYCRFLLAKLPPIDWEQKRNYLFRIATNLLRDRWRSRKDSPLPDNFAEIASAAPFSDRQLEMRQAFERLKLRERQLLWLAYVEGSNHKEIAEALGLRPGSIRLLLFRARRRLASLISGDFPDRELLK